ncbi:hypothetical protein BP00DRAFT_75184 [Aspergillus indologenus CBS 114.80]|uniref:Uncharacterized protein n=1 Tax=Aspergillus indologenus CBS 114.80 TaxID=1450541 RepID=A0A2V5IC91_9EURO|nr:hypothetical protein BP00DRAFT_75184 [Aspergillus indologenus CBS 114.80]
MPLDLLYYGSPGRILSMRLCRILSINTSAILRRTTANRSLPSSNPDSPCPALVVKLPSASQAPLQYSALRCGNRMLSLMWLVGKGSPPETLLSCGVVNVNAIAVCDFRSKKTPASHVALHLLNRPCTLRELVHIACMMRVVILVEIENTLSNSSFLYSSQLGP